MAIICHLPQVMNGAKEWLEKHIYGYQQCVKWCSWSILILIHVLNSQIGVVAMQKTILLFLVPICHKEAFICHWWWMEPKWLEKHHIYGYQHFSTCSWSNICKPKCLLYRYTLLCKKLIRSKIYFLRTFFLNWPSYIDIFQQKCFSYFLDGLSRTRSTQIIIDKDEINLLVYILIFNINAFLT
jgi:hypothetical protein